MSENSVRNTNNAPGKLTGSRQSQHPEAAFGADYLALLRQRVDGNRRTTAKPGGGKGGKAAGGKK